MARDSRGSGGLQDNYYGCIQDNPHGMFSGNRVLLPHDVAPGAEVTFSFVIKPLSCGFTAAAPFRFRILSQTHGTNVHVRAAVNRVRDDFPCVLDIRRE